MEKLAIDVVIIPPEEIMDISIKINKIARKSGNYYGPLSKDDFYPHISLAMGTIDEKDLDEVKEIVKSVIKGYKPIDIEISNLSLGTKKESDKMYYLEINKNSELQKLHEELMNELDKYLTI